MSRSIEEVAALFPYLKTVNVRFDGNSKEYSYTLKQKIHLSVGDLVLVPTKDTFTLARVVSISNKVTQLYRGIYCKVDAERFNNYEMRSTDVLMTIASWATANEQYATSTNYDCFYQSF